jgi:hypothetical protein
MDFQLRDRRDYSFSLFLQRRSLLVMRKDARYQWMHGIARRRVDMINGEPFERTRRISLTYRFLTGDAYTRCRNCGEIGHNSRTCHRQFGDLDNSDAAHQNS